MTEPVRRTRGLFLGRIFGARVVVQFSTLIMLVALALLFSSGSGMELNRRTFALGMLLALLLFVSVFVHEVAHAFTAKAFKREVQEIVITLWGGHTSFDARAITPAVSGMTAAAGPVANLLIALIAEAVLITGLVTAESAVMVITWVAYANVILAVFNALPGIPMDGGRVLESIVWAITGDRHRATRVAAWGGRVVAVAVVAYAIGTPILAGSRPSAFQVIWALVIFGILWPAASGALKISQIMARREGLTAQRLMVSAVGVPHDVTVAEARDRARDASAVEVVVLAADGTPAGHFPVSLTEAVPREDQHSASLQTVTMPLPRGTEIPPSTQGDDLVEALREWWGKSDVWVVTDGPAVVGVVRLADALKALQ